MEAHLLAACIMTNEITEYKKKEAINALKVYTYMINIIKVYATMAKKKEKQISVLCNQCYKYATKHYPSLYLTQTVINTYTYCIVYMHVP
jgi:hypothetical protein